MSRRLPSRLRARWDEVVATEGKSLGLSDCRVFLENKLVNDIFYEGKCNGRPCVVKCSSRAPESISNEYEMSRRLASADPGACAAALAKWTSPDGRMAFVVSERLPGPSLTDLLKRGASNDEAIGAIEDMIRIAKALLKTGIVWRDIISDNLLLDSDGHYRLIDAQFAVDRNAFREDPYLEARWTYRNTVFAYHPMMAGRGWNDAAMMLFHVWKLSESPRAVELCNELRSMTEADAFPVEFGAMDELRMRWILLRLCIARPFAPKSKRASIDNRIMHARAFIRRDCSDWNKVLYGHSEGCSR